MQSIYQSPASISDSSYLNVTGVRVRVSLFLKLSSSHMPKTPSTNSARPALRRNQVFDSLYNLMFWLFYLFSVRLVVRAADESLCAVHFISSSESFPAHYLFQKCDAARPHCGTCVRYVGNIFVLPGKSMLDWRQWEDLVRVPAPIGYVCVSFDRSVLLGHNAGLVVIRRNHNALMIRWKDWS